MIPKSHIERMRLRKEAYGNERRANMEKMILEHGTPLPKAVEIKDIDKTVEEWVENSLDIVYDGKKLPTFKLFANQRLNEYAQTWNHLDEVGNLLMNFKTISRDNNPKKGENQGQNYNIPGERDYPMFIVPILQENGLEAYDLYTMKQPFTIDLFYEVTIITNKYELINEMNQLVNDKFKSIDCYIFPNEHPMPMTLEDISDESEYSLDDRKYYSQNYKIKVKAYIIKEEDFKVTKVESRVKVGLLNTSDKRKHVPTVSLEEELFEENPCKAELEPRYYYKGLTLNINFPNCLRFVEFVADTNMTFESVNMDNVYDIIVEVNGERLPLEDFTELYKDDILHIEISAEDEFADSKITFRGYDTLSVIDSTTYDAESQLDSVDDNEEITIN